MQKLQQLSSSPQLQLTTVLSTASPMSRVLVFGSISFRLGDEKARTGKDFADIDFRRAVQRTSKVSLPCPPSDSLSAIEPAKTRLDNIIEKLEKKYSNPITFEEDEQSNVGDEEAEESDLMDISTKKRKRKSRDTYDMGDSFIDDTDAFKEVEKAYESRRLKTKYSGFFVNSGDLEVTSALDQPDSESSEDGTGKTKFRILKRPEVAAAFERFRDAVSRSQVKFNRHRFPTTLNEALLQLDDVAQRQQVHQEGEYFACISEALSGSLPANKIKGHLLICRKHAKVNLAKEDIESLCTKFSNYIMQFLKKVEPSSATHGDDLTATLTQSTQPTQQSDDGKIPAVEAIGILFNDFQD